MSDPRTLEIGESIIYHDETGVPHDALVICIHDNVDENGVWTTEMPSHEDTPDFKTPEFEAFMEESEYDSYRNYDGGPMINVVIASPDPERTDAYGRQIERPSSVPHRSAAVHGRYWRWPDEDPNPVTNSHC